MFLDLFTVVKEADTVFPLLSGVVLGELFKDILVDHTTLERQIFDTSQDFPSVQKLTGAVHNLADDAFLTCCDTC